MKTILVSVKPKYAELEMSGKKTIEVRKFYIKPPFKVVNYVIKDKIGTGIFMYGTELMGGYLLSGKVVYEYVVNKVDKIINRGNGFYIDGENNGYTNLIAKASCLDFIDLKNYFKEKNGYALHISDLKIYDKPKELKKFATMCKHSGEKPITRPPQDFVYVEEI